MCCDWNPRYFYFYFIVYKENVLPMMQSVDILTGKTKKELNCTMPFENMNIQLWPLDCHERSMKLSWPEKGSTHSANTGTFYRNDLATAVWWVLSSDASQSAAAVHLHWKSLLVEEREEKTFIMLNVLWLSWLKPVVQCGPSQQREEEGEECQWYHHYPLKAALGYIFM